MAKIKICGITTLDDGRAALESGADMLGFNFYRPSPRFIEPEAARAIIESLKPPNENYPFQSVGIFVNAPLEDLLRAVNVSGVDAVQLHGDESPEYCAKVKSNLDGIEIIKALHVGPNFDPRDTAGYRADAIMLDAFHNELRGGTGLVIDWQVARAVGAVVDRLFLSGGLSPENVAEAIASVQPYAVDACSSLESVPGRKDTARMSEFVRAARNG